MKLLNGTVAHEAHSGQTHIRLYFNKTGEYTGERHTSVDGVLFKGMGPAAAAAILRDMADKIEKLEETAVEAL